VNVDNVEVIQSDIIRRRNKTGLFLGKRGQISLYFEGISFVLLLYCILLRGFKYLNISSFPMLELIVTLLRREMFRSLIIYP